MSSQKFSVFLTQIAQALREEKGPELAYLLKPTSDHGKGIIKDFRGNITVSGVSQAEQTLCLPTE